MSQTDRERIFEENPTPKYLWCLHCERTYKNGEYRLVKNLQMCPYEDCDGDTVIDAWNWEDIKEKHPTYPEIPVKDVVYPMYSKNYKEKV